MNKKELQEYYKNIYNKELASSTLSKWVATGKLKAEKAENGTYNYDLDSFKSIIESPDYEKHLRAYKEKP